MESSILPISGKSSQKVVGIAAGEAHTLALTAEGSIYSWGRGTLGRLGTGKEDDELFPVRIRFDLGCKVNFAEKFEGETLKKTQKFVDVASGAYHGLALEDDGSVWSWGYNIYGQLGLDREDSSIPYLVERFLEIGSLGSLSDEPISKNKAPIKVCSVKAGGMMSLAIDSLGGLWMWGNCPHNGKDSDEFCLVSSHTPLPLWDFHGHSVVKVACGNEHVVALVSAGEISSGDDLVCYAWGNNNHGQLGLGDNESRNSPKVVPTFSDRSPWTIYEIACGAFHTAILTRKKRHSDILDPFSNQELENRVSICWTFGLGDNGQLGNGTTNSSSTPKAVKELPRDVFLKSIDCGLFHTCVVSADGDVWSWGMEKGLGLCPDASFTGMDAGDALSPLQISCGELNVLKFAGSVQVACGAAHTVLVGHDGCRLWAWGRGRSGVLGRGNEVDCFVPCIVMWPPLDKDFEKEDGLATVGMEEKPEGRIAEMEERISSLTEERELLRSNLTLMERYANVLHVSIFGEPLKGQDLLLTRRDLHVFDIQKEWENMIELMDHGKLARMEAFYQSMLAGVKDVMMKRRLHEMIKEYFHTLSMGSQLHAEKGSRSQQGQE